MAAGESEGKDSDVIEYTFTGPLADLVINNIQLPFIKKKKLIKEKALAEEEERSLNAVEEEEEEVEANKKMSPAVAAQGVQHVNIPPKPDPMSVLSNPSGMKGGEPIDSKPPVAVMGGSKRAKRDFGDIMEVEEEKRAATNVDVQFTQLLNRTSRGDVTADQLNMLSTAIEHGRTSGTAKLEAAQDTETEGHEDNDAPVVSAFAAAASAGIGAESVPTQSSGGTEAWIESMNQVKTLDK